MSVESQSVYNGFALSIEALLSLFIIVPIIVLLGTCSTYGMGDVYEYIFLSDVFEVLEKEKHDELVNWIESGNEEIKETLERIREINHRKVFLSYYNRKIPDYDCEVEIKIPRLIVTENDQRRVWLNLCKG